jgi:hypothetical protein
MLVYSEFRKSKFYPFKSALRILWTGASGFLVLLVLWFSGFLVLLVLSGFLVLCETRVSLSGDLATENVRSKCQNDPWGRAQLSRVIDS